MSALKPFPVRFLDAAPEGGLLPYAATPSWLKRPWIKPGTPGLMHRIGGIEKQVNTGHLDYSPANHQAMTDLRRDKVTALRTAFRIRTCLGGRRAASSPWSAGAAPSARSIRRCAAPVPKGRTSHIHIRHIWPMPQESGRSAQEL
jgi:2-oxoglutarate ferredoxin oxidoreductase subunit alpha